MARSFHLRPKRRSKIWSTVSPNTLSLWERPCIDAIGGRMLIGRDRECSRLRGAILAKQSLLLWGPPAFGKSALLQEVLASLPGEIRRKCLICHAASPPHAVWVELIRALAHASDPLIT